jgi:hypothetical protein
MLGQVRTLGILMIVQGTLAAALGVIYLIAAPGVWVIGPMLRGSLPGSDDEGFLVFATTVYLVLGIPVLIAGIMNVAAGVRILNTRGRIFAIVALFTNIIPLFTCYCTPTSLGLMIYGLIILFQADVAGAFRRVAAGGLPDPDKAPFSRASRPGDDEAF